MALVVAVSYFKFVVIIVVAVLVHHLAVACSTVCGVDNFLRSRTFGNRGKMINVHNSFGSGWAAMAAETSLVSGQKAAARSEEPVGAMASRIRIRVYRGSSMADSASVDVPVRQGGLIYNEIDNARPLVLYIHGFREHPSNESIRTIVGAHLERGTDNIMLLDWSDLAFENYITVARRVREIGRILAETFDDLVHLGLDLESFHLVGHSLGAQIAGFLGKYSRYSIPRLTALDPAKPGFYHPGAEHVDADSARFVDVVHTDGGAYGASVATGSVDFYANGGTRPQPGCPFLGVPVTPSDLCNHWRSWRYYAESINNEIAFPATQCPSYRDFVSGECTWNRRVYFGYATSKHARGSFYFTTRDKSPFGGEQSVYA